MLQQESEAIRDSIPFLGDESKQLNYFKPYMINPEPEPPEITLTFGQ